MKTRANGQKEIKCSDIAHSNYCSANVTTATFTCSKSTINQHQNNVWNLFRLIQDVLIVNFWTGFTSCSDVSNVDFKQINAGWEYPWHHNCF